MAEVKPRFVFRSDFDGVFNMPEVGAEAFFQMYSGYIAGHIGLKPPVLKRVFREARQIIEAEPEKYGWVINGQLVCPWYADHYQESKAIADVGLDFIRTNHIPTLYHVPTKEEVPEFLNGAFQAVHPHIIAPPRPEAREAIELLIQATDFGIISNSETENVRKGLVKIFDGDEEKTKKIRVVGGAKKQKIEPSYLGIKKSQKVDGMKRRPLLRRKQFIETLKQEQAEGYMEDVADFLYAPAALGLFPVLLKSSRTTQAEIDFFAKNGVVARNLLEAVDFIAERAFTFKHA